MAFSNRAQLCMLASDTAGALDWGGRAIALAESLGEEEIVIHALNNVGAAAFESGRPDGRAALEHSLAMAKAAGYEEHVARAYCNLTSIAVKLKQHAEAAQVIADGVAFCTENDLDSWTRYILAWRSVGELNAGHYDAAIATASDMLSDPSTAVISRIPALVGMGLAYARRGNARHEAVLAEALRLARPTGELQRVGQVAARAGRGRLARRRRRGLAAPPPSWRGTSRASAASAGSPASWRCGAARAGVAEPPPDWIAEPYLLEISGPARRGGRVLDRAALPVRGGAGAGGPRRAGPARRARRGRCGCAGAARARPRASTPPA